MLLRPSMLALALAAARVADAADGALASALDAAREATARNRRIVTTCQKRLAVKLVALEDALRDLEPRATKPGVVHAQDRIAAATALLENKCPRRLVAVVGRNLDEVAAHLRAVRVDGSPVARAGSSG